MMEESKPQPKMSRLREKLLGRTKEHSSEAEISNFLNGPSDKLQMTGAAPPTPRLQKIDTSSAHRWPSAAEINSRVKSASEAQRSRPRRNTTDLVVRFTDQEPEEIGYGGDEEEAPTMRISSNKAMNRKKKKQESQMNSGRSHAQSLQSETGSGAPEAVQAQVEEISGKIHEMSIPGNEEIVETVSKDDFSSKGYLRVEPPEPSSATARIQAEMRAAEGMSLRNSVLLGLEVGSPTASETSDEIPPTTPPNHLESPQAQRISPIARFQATESKINGLVQSSPRNSPSIASNSPASPPPLHKAPTWTMKDAAIAVRDDALDDFTNRVRHMFSLFNLSAESGKPISNTSLEQLLTAASWWFLKGRTALEATIRERNPNPEVQNANQIVRQQAFANLAKSLWLVKYVVPMNGEFKNHHHQEFRDEQATDQLETHHAVLTSLNKLMMSMKRNNILPPAPGEAPLPQGLDTSIWIKYPDFTPDIVSLLSNNGKGSLVTNNNQSTTFLSEIIALGDTRRSFNFGRMFVEGFLMEEGIESQQFRCPCVLSMSRGQKDTQMALNLTSQNGLIKLCVQSDKSRGLTWKDLQWRPSRNAIELKLPRGFIFKVQCSPQDFASLYGIYDYTIKMLSTMEPHRDETALFESRLMMLQFFDQNQQSRAFPKEPLPQCRVRLLEKKLTKAEGTGARSFHRGFRLVVLTSPRTKNLSGINAEFLPMKGPILYSLMRGEGGAPALMLKIQQGKLQGSLVMTFNELDERAQLHSLLIASSLADTEARFADCQLLGFSINQPNVPPPGALKMLKWQNAVVINEGESDAGVESTKTVLSEQLRVVLNFQNGSLTDRMNVGKGELKLRLNADENRNELQLLRRSQEDMTIAVSDSHVPKQLPGELAELLKMIAESANVIHTYKFPSLMDLHRFQAAITGFNVLFDGTAASFAISRRRMVVPIYKKWDATTTRLQVIQQDKIIQLLAFFNNFSHGECMNFTLKGTDNFETSSKAGRYVLKIVDAKFALPKGVEEKGAERVIENSFICLDMPDYPGEHDDITITFDSEAEHEKFTQALPAAPKLASRMGSIRR